ncbi:hypothetical protein EGW08_016162 [Elysia chlorotica]|uniref:Ribitol-5-phosphate transferase FKTN N-terminal domain-containing protein n=1 Tax=Elysia chlorotica TaxID=188477 RepID=A0A3S1B4U4_ELYCH|nr:hypothetical protein EGW08_016162 [Elysia chlorotica]
MTPRKILEERPPWEAVNLFLGKCEDSGLPVFVIEPSLLRAIRDGSTRRVELWNKAKQNIVTFGVISPGLDQLHLVMSAMKRENYEYWEKNDPDPRGLSLETQRSYRVVPSHFLLWVPVEINLPMIIHVVVLYKRGEFLWHAPIADKEHTPPFSLADSPFSNTAGSFKDFSISTSKINGTSLRHPQDTFGFLEEVESSEFIECNYSRAYHFFSLYHKDKGQRAQTFKQKARQLILTAKTVLDSMGIPFWLSSGTCLGWFRQCDIISHTTDVDIGIFIKDYRPELVNLLESKGLTLTHHFGKVSDSLELSFLYGDLKLDIFFFYHSPKYIWNGGTQASTGNKYKYIFPHFKLCWTEFLEMWVRVPCPTDPYIHANYGSRWMVPLQSWDWKSSPNNVIENGRWPEEERDEVIQLYE